MTEFDVGDAFEQLQERLRQDLEGGQLSAHPGTKGTHAELQWRVMLREFLPARYEVEPAFIVDVNSQVSDQLDLVVYDRQYSPLLFTVGGVRHIPAESVYAVFEVKPGFSKANFEYAAEKVASVRRLERTSAPIVHAGGEFAARDPFPIIGGILARNSDWSPPFDGPFEAALRAPDSLDTLDLGCAIDSGSFALDDAGVTTDTEAPLMFFVLKLFARLQRCGTVPALDLDRWWAAGLG